jgi:hypothetical protein
LSVFAVLYRMEWRLFRRDIFLWSAQVLLLLYFAAVGWYNCRYPLGGKLDAGDMLQSASIPVVMGVTVIGLITGVLAARRERTAHFAEVLAALPGDAARPFAKLAAWATVTLVFSFLAIACTLGVQWLAGSQLIFFWPTTLLYIVIYWGLPMLSAGILGYALGIAVSSNWVYPLVFLVWLALTPFNHLLYLPEPLRIWLNQGEINPGTPYSGYEGLAVNPAAFLRHLFLPQLALSFLAFSLLVRQLRDMTRAELAALVSLAFLSLVGGTALIALANPYPIEEDTAALFLRDARYYHEFQQRHPLGSPYARPPFFNVESYTINLEHRGYRMRYTARMRLHAGEGAGRLEFSLYHGYKVLKAEAGGRKVTWGQEGDLLWLKWPGGKKEETVTFRVEGSPGSGGILKPQALYLPSGFPWYPIPGRWRLAENARLYPSNHDCLFRNLEPARPLNFQLTVSSPLKIYSNLPETGSNTFAGEVSGPTVMAGKLLEVRVDGYRIIAPPDIVRRIPVLLPGLREGVRAVGERLGVASPRVPSNVFVAPLYSTGNLNLPVRLFSDQLHLDENQCRLYFGSEEKFFARASSLAPACFWYNRYRESDGYAPHFLADFYVHLYEQPIMSAYLNAPVLSVHREAAREILRLEREGKRLRLEQALATWYQRLAQGAAGDAWQDLHTILVTGGKNSD